MASTKQTDEQLFAELLTQYKESEKDIAKIRDDADFSWDEREALLVGKLYDQGSQNTKSKVNTQDLTNLIFDGASRVMAQFPTGKIQALTKEDKGKNILMNLVHEKYIIPNANAQFDFMTKLRIWDIYSRVFGAMPALVDYRVEDEYIGPDMWLIHPRNFFPQAGCVNIQEMQYCQVSTWVSADYLETRDKKVWKNIPELIQKVKEGGKTKQQMEQQLIPFNERSKDIQTQPGKYAQVELRTRYERDRWVTYAPDYQLIVRDIPNPQSNNEIPIVMKQCFPLIDRLYGLAEFERGRTLQYAANSLVNMYLDSVKMSIFPPLLLDSTGVVASSIKYAPAEKWLMTKPNAISQLQLSPQGLNTFNSTYSFLKSMLLNMGATTDTSVGKDTDPGMGKTPEALKQQNSREGARDNWDRFMMEQAVEQVYNKQIDLLVTKQEKPIDITLFKKDIEDLQKNYPEEQIVDVFQSGEAGKVTVNKDTWGKNVKYRFYIDAGSTMKKDEGIEHDALTNIIALTLKIPGAVEQIAQTGEYRIGDKVFDFGESLKRYIITSGIQDGEKIIHDTTEEQQMQGQEQGQQVMQIQQQVQQLTQAVQELMQKAGEKKEKTPKETLTYRDAPEDVKRQIEQQAGLNPSRMGATDQFIDQAQDPIQEAISHLQANHPDNQLMQPDGNIPTNLPNSPVQGPSGPPEAPTGFNPGI